ncbi:MAG: Hsp20 family protein [Rhizobiales bacterium]|nr:Hsp20 family protein [Hyphomicrobiales bacterium]MBI3674413.1 Hsp20 family protein [Hyphomicrobiales bacterium]
MATLDFEPLFRTTVGFDRVPMLLSHAMQRDDSGYPPYNIEKYGDDEYRIVLAIAGFTRDDIEIVCEQSLLTIRGQLKQKNAHEYLHRGIATLDFERTFELADHIEVTGATMTDGLLVVDLKRELPEALKPRKIEIGAAQVKQVEHKKHDKAAA